MFFYIYAQISESRNLERNEKGYSAMIPTFRSLRCSRCKSKGVSTPVKISATTTTIVGYRRQLGFSHLVTVCPVCKLYVVLPPTVGVELAESLGCARRWDTLDRRPGGDEYAPPAVVAAFEADTGRSVVTENSLWPWEEDLVMYFRGLLNDRAHPDRIHAELLT